MHWCDVFQNRSSEQSSRGDLGLLPDGKHLKQNSRLTPVLPPGPSSQHMVRTPLNCYSTELYPSALRPPKGLE